MGLYKLFSYNVEVQYMSCFLSKATLFTLATTVLNFILPFIIAYRGRGFWLRSHSFYEQPAVQFTYEYLLVAETDDPTVSIQCGATNESFEDFMKNEENCVEFQVQEYDVTGDKSNDVLDFKFFLNVPQERTVTSLILMLGFNFQLKSVCPLQMQSLVLVNKEFTTPPSGFKHFADLEFYQIAHLPCKHNLVHTKYNNSVFNYDKKKPGNTIDYILEKYYMREVTTHTKTLYSRSQNGHTGSVQIQVSVRVPEMEVKYIPSLIQEIKWAWPQYLSLVVVFYWIFNKIKKFVFNNRLVMAWEILPWKKQQIVTKKKYY